MEEALLCWCLWTCQALFAWVCTGYFQGKLGRSRRSWRYRTLSTQDII